MTMPASGAPIAFSHLQAVFSGVHPIGIDEYYQNASTGYTSGVTGIPNINSGIPNINSPISLYMFYDKAKPVVSSGFLYNFTTHTFTNAGQIGRTGPTLSQVQSAYNTVNWAQNTAYLTMNTTGIQEWKVPAAGSYSIQVVGAGGGDSGYGGGKGARMIGTFNLNQGMVLAILVGQQGGVKNSGCNAGGGGGTFVWDKSDTTKLLIVGGGGGGCHACGSTSGLDAPTTINGTGEFAGSTTAGSNGNGATPGGSGWLSNGTSGLDGNNSGTTRPLEGGLGGLALATRVGDGGFGGGASASGQDCSNGGSGGGGGYSGGAGPSANETCVTGGGGGSYNSGTNQNNTAGVNAGHGYVIIDYLSPPPAVNYMLSGNGVASMVTGTTFINTLTDDGFDNIGTVGFPFFWFGTDWGSSNNIQWTTNNVLTFGGGNAQYNEWTATTGKGVLIGQRDRMTNFANEFAPLINHNNTNHSIKRFNANQRDYGSAAVTMELDIRLIRGPEYQYIEIRLGNLVNVNLGNAGLWRLSDGGTFYYPFSLNAQGRPIDSNQSLVLRGDLNGYNWECFPQHYMNLGI